MNRGRALMSVALALTLAPWTAHAAEPSVALEIDVSALPDDEVTADLEGWLGQHQTEVLHEGGIETSADAPRVVRVFVSRYGEGDVHYRATVELLDRSTEAMELQRTVDCELCRDTDLAREIGHEVARVSGYLLRDSVDEPEVPIEPSPPPVRPQSVPVSSSKTKSIGSRGFAGVGMMVVGMGMMGASLPLLLQADQKGVGRRKLGRQAILIGSSLLGVGGSALVTGAILVALDTRRPKHERSPKRSPKRSPRRSPRRPKASLIPTVAPTTLTLTVRF